MRAYACSSLILYKACAFQRYDIEGVQRKHLCLNSLCCYRGDLPTDTAASRILYKVNTVSSNDFKTSPTWVLYGCSTSVYSMFTLLTVLRCLFAV